LKAKNCEHSQEYIDKWASSQLGYPKGWSNGKKIAKDYFGFLLYLLFHGYSGLVYDYNYNDVMLI